MRKYILKKATYAIASLFIIATLNFMVLQVFSPIDPVAFYWNPEIPVSVLDALRQQFGLDQPLSVRYVKYIQNLFTFQFGVSFATRGPVVNELLNRLPNTLLLVGLAQVVTILIGIVTGVFAASRRGTKADVLVMGPALFARAAPIFFIQLFFLLIFAYHFRLFPLGKMHSIPAPTEPLLYVADTLYHMALPVFTMVLTSFGAWALYTRNIMLEVLTQDYIVTARAKGLKNRTVLVSHGLRAVLPPITTMMMTAVAALITGSIITEYVFSLPGIGQWLLHSIIINDFPAIQGTFFIYAILMIASNMIADIIYGFLDPRIRVGVRR